MDFAGNGITVLATFLIFFFIRAESPERNRAIIFAQSMVTWIGLCLVESIFLAVFRIYTLKALVSIQGATIFFIAILFFKKNTGYKKKLTGDPILSSTSSGIYILCLASMAAGIWFGFFAQPYTCDALLYHLPQASSIIQNNGFIKFSNDLVSWTAFQAGYPKNWPLILLNLNLLSPETRLLNLYPFYFSLLSVLSVYSMALDTGSNRKSAFSASVIFFLIPMVSIHNNVLMNNLPFSGLILFCSASLINMRHTKDRFSIFPFGLALGSLTGMKSHGPIYLVFFLCLMAFLFFRNEGLRKITLKNPWFFPAAAATAWCGGIYCFLNFIWYKNPLFPFLINIMGIRIWDGPFLPEKITSSIPPFIQNAPFLKKIFYSFFEIGCSSYNHSMRWGGFGKTFCLILLPAFAITLVISFFRNRHKNMRITLISGIFLLIITPVPFWTRFILFFPGFCLVALAWILSRQYLHCPLTVFMTIIFSLNISSFIMPVGYDNSENKILLLHPHSDSARNVPEFLSQFSCHSLKFRQDLLEINRLVHSENNFRTSKIYYTVDKKPVSDFSITGLDRTPKMIFLPLKTDMSELNIKIVEPAYFLFPASVYKCFNFKKNSIVFQGKELLMVKIFHGSFSYKSKNLSFSE